MHRKVNKYTYHTNWGYIDTNWKCISFKYILRLQQKMICHFILFYSCFLILNTTKMQKMTITVSQKPPGDIFKYLVLSDQQPRTQICSIHNVIKIEKKQTLMFKDLKKTKTRMFEKVVLFVLLTLTWNPLDEKSLMCEFLSVLTQIHI